MSTICLLVTVSFSLGEERIQQICSNPDPERAFNVMVRRRRAEVEVSTLSAEQKRELVKAKDKELNTFVKYSVVEAASRQGISPSSLMKMRWVVTFKDDGSLKARLVVQSFTEQRLGKTQTSSPTASRRSRQIFLTLAASLGFQTHKGDVKCAFLQGDLDEQHGDDDDDDDNFKIESAQPVSDTFCEPVPELSRKLQLEHHQCIRLLKAVYGLVNAPRRWYHRVATDLRNMRGEESVMEPCLWTFQMKTVSFMLCAWFTAMTSCWRAVTLHLENMSLTVLTICTTGESGSHECSNSAAHKSHKPTINTPERGADLRSASQIRERDFDHHLANIHKCWMDQHFTRWPAGLHYKLRVVARQRIKHVSDILAFESIETGGKIFICSRDSSSGRRR